MDEPILLGDIFLVVGNWKLISQLGQKGRDFVVLNMPIEESDASPAHSQAPHAIFCPGIDGCPDADGRDP